MTVRNLEYLFKPKSVAVIGASIQPETVGLMVMRNLLRGGFSGPIMPVNPGYEAVEGVLTYPDIASLPRVPDLAVVCTPAPTVPGIIGELGELGTRAAIVITAGLRRFQDENGKNLEEAMLEAARPHLLRIIGPNCAGILAPLVSLNASFAHTSATPGSLAFISQSGGLCTGVLDWANSKGIGFSHFISLGNSADVDFGDLLDYLGGDPSTRAILLYIEAIKDARKFMSAGRSAARNKPVIAVKAGRAPEGAAAAASHTGALAGQDDVYEAALRRCGMLRVLSIDDLFASVETLGRARPLRGNRLAILTNGGGAGVMATDAWALDGGALAKLSPETMAKLDAALPQIWSHANPIDIIGDAPTERYVDSLQVLLDDPEVDAILLIHSPSAIVPTTAIARAVAKVAQGAEKNVVASWIGGRSVEEARRVCSEAGIPSYETPEEAVQALQQILHYRRNQEILMETPRAISDRFKPDPDAARAVIRQAIEEGREILTEPEAKSVLAAYRIPVVVTRIGKNPEEAASIAKEIGFPVAIKILSPQVTHKSDMGGVALDLDTEEAVIAAAEGMIGRLSAHLPDADLTGFTVQPMARRPGSQELIVGVTTDAVFGPVILFGQGGTAVEVVADRAVALPPLNLSLARHLVERTRVVRLLRGYRDRKPANLDAIYLTLVQVSQLITDLGEIAELDINPLLADHLGVLALDARIRVTPSVEPGARRLAIRPYPASLEETITLEGRKILLRPIRPEDEPQHYAFVDRLDREDIRLRFFGMLRRFPHSEMARFTQIDYEREMAFIASAEGEVGQRETIGVVRAVSDPDNIRASCALIVVPEMKGTGLARVLLEKMIRYCKNRGTKQLIGRALPENSRMIGLAMKMNFSVRPLEGEKGMEILMDLE